MYQGSPYRMDVVGVYFSNCKSASDIVSNNLFKTSRSHSQPQWALYSTRQDERKREKPQSPIPKAQCDFRQRKRHHKAWSYISLNDERGNVMIPNGEESLSTVSQQLVLVDYQQKCRYTSAKYCFLLRILAKHALRSGFAAPILEPIFLSLQR